MQGSPPPSSPPSAATLPRLLLLLALALCTSPGWAFAVAAAAAAPTTPNIILLLADDQGWGDVGYNEVHYNSSSYATGWRLNPPNTPHLDAMAAGDHTIVFSRFYSGAAVCSPTRASILSGRHPGRECIDNAEGCGSAPAWSCKDRLPFPKPTYTVAEAVKTLNYSTIHLGKWHLGDFFFKGDGEGDKLNPRDRHRRPAMMPKGAGSYAYSKWPVSNPGMHGFDTWRSTEASASSSTTNCDCKVAWGKEGRGCIASGGVWGAHGDGCTNYWFPKAGPGGGTHRMHCTNMSNPRGVLAQHCVTNETQKIVGDDSQYILDHLDAFLTDTVHQKKPFLAVVWFHSIHEPHPALPEYYHSYTDVFGDPAGDYLGTLSQMDAAVGRLRNMLKQHGVSNNTMLWYTADNGPHTSSGPTPGRDRNAFPALAATNGLRGCKASYYEGGIRVPGMLEWPAVIHANSRTWHPSSTHDYMPTILDLLGLQHPRPGWAADGMSLLPLIRELAARPNANDTSPRPDDRPLVFPGAIIRNQYKFTTGGTGQCQAEHGSGPAKGGHFLFNLEDDPTESHDLCNKHAKLCRQYKEEFAALAKSVTHSRQFESLCERPPAVSTSSEK